LTDVPGLSDWKSLGFESIVYTEANPAELAKHILSMLLYPIYPTKDQIEMIRDGFGDKRGATEYFNLYMNYSFRS
jgi:hypothetical protein